MLALMEAALSGVSACLVEAKLCTRYVIIVAEVSQKYNITINSLPRSLSQEVSKRILTNQGFNPLLRSLESYRTVARAKPDL